VAVFSDRARWREESPLAPEGGIKKLKVKSSNVKAKTNFVIAGQSVKEMSSGHL